MLVIALAGLAHLIRTCAWRLTLPDPRRRPPFGRMLALRLTSEAAGQVGVFGQVFGDTWRVAGLGAELPLGARITSIALDRALFTLSSTIVTIAGIASVVFLLPLSTRLAAYAALFGFALIATVLVATFAVRRRWAVLSGTAGALHRLGKIGRWLQSRQETIRSVEDRLLDFFHHSPAAFWKSFALQMAGQTAALLEVYLVLRLMGCRVGFSSALAIEGLTKLVNVIGLINPGNAGTYEGGNRLLAKLLGMGGAVGLTLGLIRRTRALFWAAAGAICAVTLPGPARRRKPKVPEPGDSSGHGHTAIILAHGVPADSLLASVGALPVLLRAILGEHKTGAKRIVVIVDPASGPRVRKVLHRTRRLPGNVEWCPPVPGEISCLLREIGASQDRVVWVAADRTYHPSLHRRAAEWEGAEALALTTDGQPADIFTSSTYQAISMLEECPASPRTVEELLGWLIGVDGVVCESVPPDQWQRISPEGRLLAERKLDQWLVKPTDGVFARMNRKVSIPISRQLIRFPITPNMVSLFTLGVSFLAGVFFALGGRWNMFCRRGPVGLREHSGRL